MGGLKRKYDIVSDLELGALPRPVQQEIMNRELQMQVKNEKSFTLGEAHNIFHIIQQTVLADYVRRKTNHLPLFDSKQPPVKLSISYSNVRGYYQSPNRK